MQNRMKQAKYKNVMMMMMKTQNKIMTSNFWGGKKMNEIKRFVLNKHLC